MLIVNIQAANGEDTPVSKQMIAGLVETCPFEHKYLMAGQLIDLGGRQFEVIETPGHTPGSICLLSSREYLLIAGDTIVATPVWLYLKHSSPLHVYYESLLMLKTYGFPNLTILPGHPPAPLGVEMLTDLIVCCEEIMHDPGRGVFTRTFAGEGYQWARGKATIIYDPNKI